MTAALTIRNLHKIYHDGPHALKGINLTINKGEFFALLGPNGAGKSTIIGILSSLVRKTQGTVTIAGYDLDTHSAQARYQMGVVAQEINLGTFDIVEDLMIYQAGYFGIPWRQAKRRAKELLFQLDLWGKRRNRVNELSGGMKRRLMIALAMVHNPAILILDEPTAGVDIELRHSLYQYLKEINSLGTTIILTTHYLEEAEMLCDRIAIINHGEVVLNIPKSELTMRLDKQIFRLEVSECGTLTIPFTKVGKNEIEVSIDNKSSLNDLFTELSAKNIKVHSITPTSNRLEQLFLQQTKGVNDDA